MTTLFTRRTAAALAMAGLALALTGCAPQTAADRNELWGSEIEERILDRSPAVETVQAGGSVVVLLGFADAMDDPEQWPSVGQAMVEGAEAVAASPLGTLPLTIQATRVGDLSGCRWNGFDPERTDRYLAATLLWVELSNDQLTELVAVPEVIVYGNTISIELIPPADAEVPQEVLDTITARMLDAGFASVDVGA